MHVVLVNPEIPQNTGNIARTCALTRSTLHLVKPLGFSVDDRYLKRAGLDYWDKVEVKVWDSFGEVVENYRNSNIYLATTKAHTGYWEVDYQLDDMVVFGCETQGLPREILERYPRQQIRIPILDIGRSLNLSNSVAIVVYEVLRQHNFPDLK